MLSDTAHGVAQRALLRESGRVPHERAWVSPLRRRSWNPASRQPGSNRTAGHPGGLHEGPPKCLASIDQNRSDKDSNVVNGSFILVRPTRVTRLVDSGILAAVTVDLDLLPPELARSVRAARRRRGVVVVKPFVSKGLDPVIGEWAKSIVASGELDAAIAEVAASDPDLLS